MTPGALHDNFDQNFNLLLVLNLVWFACWTFGSLAYRRAHGKPVLFFGFEQAVFQESRVSGHCTQSWISKLGGARHVLVVAVTQDRLVIRPAFPFTLFFLPEFYGLEYEVPLHDVLRAEEKKSMLWTRVHVEFRNPADNEVREVILRLRHPKEFLAALKPPRS
jgi:hypothetical protein